MGAHSFKGLAPKPQAQTYTDATQLATSGGQSLDDPFVQQFVAALQSEGFVSGIGQLYNPPKHRRLRGFAGQALSEALQLGGVAQAATESAREHQVGLTASKVRWKQFTVPAIPGSTGLLQRGSRKFGGASNVYFSDGPYAYLVGEAAPKGSGFRAVVSAATRLYQRVHVAAICP